MAYGWCQLGFLNLFGLWALVSNLIASTVVQLSFLISGCLCLYWLRYSWSYLVFLVIYWHLLLINMTFSLSPILKSLFSITFPKMRPILFLLFLLYTHYPLVWPQDLSISDCLSTKLDYVGPWDCPQAHQPSFLPQPTTPLAQSLRCSINHGILWEALGVFPICTGGSQQWPSDTEFS